MPSCVVKSCKNYLNKLNKSHGVTYHAFPRNKQRRDEWISIIRNCRKQSNWEPSYASTVCSAHFNDDDFIETATGLRCLIPFAIPSKLLSEPSETQATAPQVTPDVKKEYQDDEQPSSSTSAMPAVLQAPILRFALTRYCRLCASTNCDVMSVDVQSDSGLKNIVMNMLTRLNTNIDFNQEHFPTTICSACVKSLYTAYDFVVGIDMAQTTLNKILMQKYKYQMAENLDNDMDLSNPTLQQVSPKLETIEIETDFSSTALMQVSPKMETEECESDLSSASMVSPKIEAIENESELSSTSSQPEAEETQVSPKIEAAESDVEFATDFDQPCINESSMTTLQQPSLNTGTGTSNFKPVNFKSGDGNQSLDYYILKLEFEDALLKKQKTTERLRKTIKKLRERVRYLQKINDRKFENPFSQNAIATCLYDNFKRKLRKKNQNRYSGEFKKFCAILNDYSPTAYEYVRLSFDGCLPPSKIVERMWRDHIRRGMAKGVEENAASTSEEQEQKESV